MPLIRPAHRALWLAALLSGGMALSALAENDPIPKDPQPQTHDRQELPKTWMVTGSNPGEYEGGLDNSVTFRGKPSGYIRSTGLNLGGFGTLTSVRRAEPYRGKTIRLSAYIKTEKVQDWTGLWLRADTPETMAATFINMEDDRRLSGTLEWRRYELTLRVPPTATMIPFGLSVTGRGTSYINAVAIEVVPDAPASPQTAPKADFER